VFGIWEQALRVSGNRAEVFVLRDNAYEAHGNARRYSDHNLTFGSNAACFPCGGAPLAAVLQEGFGFLRLEAHLKGEQCIHTANDCEHFANDDIEPSRVLGTREEGFIVDEGIVSRINLDGSRGSCRGAGIPKIR
jgi:hypothetical protein